MEELFDAYAGAFLREDGVVVGAFAEPLVVFGPSATRVLASHADVAGWLVEERARLTARGVTRLEWSSLEARAIGSELHHVSVRWEHEHDDVLYVLRGQPPDAVIVGIIVGERLGDQ